MTTTFNSEDQGETELFSSEVNTDVDMIILSLSFCRYGLGIKKNECNG